MIKRRYFFYLTSLFFFLIFFQNIEAGVLVQPSFIFLNQSRGSIPITVRNPGNTAVEVWLEVKFGYVTSNDTGQTIVIYDTVGTPPQSAVPWIKFYPQRFRLEPLRTQIVRVMVSPPPSILDGEYWARIMVGNQDVKDAQRPADIGKGKSGIIFAQKIGIPLHYRKGTVTTGLDVKNVDVSVTQDKITLNMDMNRLGNASYWGGATFSLYDTQRKRVLSTKRDLVVYTNYHAKVEIDRSKIQPGTYSLEVDISPDLRTNIRKSDLIPCEPIHITKSIVLN